jgi:hypothetical protein
LQARATHKSQQVVKQIINLIHFEQLQKVETPGHQQYVPSYFPTEGQALQFG